MNIYCPLLAFIVALLPALSQAQAGGSNANCQGLVGAAAAMCMQGVGSGANRSLTGTPNREAREKAGKEEGGEPRAAAGGTHNVQPGESSVLGFFSGWTINADGDNHPCRGLVGGAASQCMQSMGSSTQRSAGTTIRSENRVANPPEANAPANRSASVGDIGSAINRFFSGWGLSADKNGRHCDGLVGGAMAQCMQGIGPGAPSREGSSR
jgi:hypothetical protein